MKEQGSRGQEEGSLVRIASERLGMQTKGSRNVGLFGDSTLS